MMKDKELEEYAKRHFDGLAAKGNWAEMLYHTENRWGDWKSLGREEQFKYVKSVVAIIVGDSTMTRTASLYSLLWSNEVQRFYNIAKPFRKLFGLGQ